MRSHKWLPYVFFLILSVPLQTPNSFSQTNLCPGPNALPHKDGTYDFTHESWLKKASSAGDKHFFGACVYNNLATGDDMAVNWKDAQLDGWAPPHDCALSVLEGPASGTELSVPSILYYGTGLVPLRVSLFRPQQTKTPRFLDIIKSVLRLAVPRNTKNVRASLTHVDLEFASGVFVLTDGSFLYFYSWLDRRANGRERAPVRFRWNSQAVRRAMAQAKLSADDLRLTETTRGVTVVNKESPAYSITSVEILDEAGRHAGGGPVAIYYPQGTKP
jgi:hypothetical protein